MQPKRRRGVAVAGRVLGLSCFLWALCLAASSATTAAAAECPNEALRVIHAEQYLPECRAYEMVSPSDKNNYNVRGDAGSFRASVSGEAVTYDTVGPLPGTQSVGTGVQPRYLARRGVDRWETISVEPPHDPNWDEIGAFGFIGETSEPEFFSPDLSEDFTTALHGGPVGSESGSATFYRRDNLSGTLDPVLSTSTFGKPQLEARSADGTKLFFESLDKLTPQGSSGQTLYEYDTVLQKLFTVGILPGEEDATTESTLGSSSGFFNVARMTDAISSDGSRVVFSDGIANFEGAFEPHNPMPEPDLYLRINPDSPDAETVKINESETEPPGPTPNGALFRGMSRDGSKVLFSTLDQLLPADTNATVDLYEYDLDKPAGERLTLISKDTEPTDGSETLVGGVLGESDDGGTIYFSALGALTRGAPTDAPNRYKLYSWNGGTVSYLAELGDWLDLQQTGKYSSAHTVYRESMDWGRGFNLYPEDSRVSANGQYLLFRTTGPVNGYDSLVELPGGSFTEYSQMYLYDSATGISTCLSCSPPRTHPTGFAAGAGGWQASIAGHSLYLPRTLIEEGSNVRVIFETQESLSPRDTNGQMDVYEYYSATGETKILSDGQSPEGSYYVDASADGGDVFIWTADSLSKWDRDSLYDIYDVRVDGGLPDPPSGPTCAGESCQPLGGGAPVATTPGSASLVAGKEKTSKPRRCRAVPKSKSKKRLARCPGSKHKSKHRKRRSHNEGGNK